MNTPWETSQTRRELAPGITEITTASHGGFHLSKQRLAALRTLIPSLAKTWVGFPWFEEDCDWAYVALAFPDAFDDHEVTCAVEMAVREGEDYLKIPPEFFETEHGRKVAERACFFRLSVRHKWCRGSMSSGGRPDWPVNFSRDGHESKWVQLADYPAQIYYTDAELAAVTVP